MKTVVIFFLIIMSILQGENSKSPVNFSVELSDTIWNVGKDIFILMKVKNISSNIVTIKNPCHWGNAYPDVLQGGNEVPMVKVKINPKVFDDVIQIIPGDTYVVYFDFALNKMVNLELSNGNKYELCFDYYVADQETSIKSNTVYFYVETDKIK